MSHLQQLDVDMKQTNKRNSKSAPAEPDSTQAETSTAQQQPLDTVRDILFGEQSRAHQQKHTELEKLIHDSLAEMRSETDKMFADVGKQLDSINKALTTEVQQREAANDMLSQTISHLDSTLQQLDASTKTADGDLHDQLLNNVERIEQTIQNLHEEMTNTLNKEVEKLDKNKADRSNLATLLSGIASQLTEAES
jgi:uncharacterized protein YicC (UPF0701 family)